MLVQRIRSLMYGQDGQTTAEYALVLIVVAIIVGLFVVFVRGGALEDMFQAIVRSLIERAT
ncbi:MAG: Flp family type IVb pilin [Actinomycetota bacterium]